MKDGEYITKTDSFRVNAPKVVSETIDGEVVIVDLEKGNYYSLLKTGQKVWSRIEQGCSQHEIITFLANHYQGTFEEIEKAVASFMQQLQEEQLIVPNPSREQSKQISETDTLDASTDKRAMEKFELPVLEKFTDMEDLLLLDPIHEVDEEAGWPTVKPMSGQPETSAKPGVAI